MDCCFYTGRFDGFVCPASDRWFCGRVARTAEFCDFGRQQRRTGTAAFGSTGFCSVRFSKCFSSWLLCASLWSSLFGTESKQTRRTCSRKRLVDAFGNGIGGNIGIAAWYCPGAGSRCAADGSAEPANALAQFCRCAEGLVVWQRQLCGLCTVTAVGCTVGCFTGCGPYDLRL